MIRMGDDGCILSWYFIGHFTVFTLWWVVFQHFQAQILRQMIIKACSGLHEQKEF